MVAHRRHDISDRTWKLLESHLPGRKGLWGGIARDNRTFINAVFWTMRTGAPWRDLPPTVTGATLTVVLLDGETKEFGESYWKFS